MSRCLLIIMIQVLCACFLVHNAYAEKLEVVIVTEIRDLGATSIQTGMKSTQTLTVDTNAKKVSAKFKTGVTDIGFAKLKSVRDMFTVSKVQFKSSQIVFTANGQTASALSIFGDIDYEFTLNINIRQRKILVSGCHNKFPSYYVEINGKRIYDRQQTGSTVTGLIGECDIRVSEYEKKFR